MCVKSVFFLFLGKEPYKSQSRSHVSKLIQSPVNLQTVQALSAYKHSLNRQHYGLNMQKGFDEAFAYAFTVVLID